EMFGNWSFGDYFKKEAVAWAWELLVDRWGFDPDRLYATVHEGDQELGLEADEEAAECWRSDSGIDPDHILFFGSKDNFWMMGDTGPCGPCSEIHIDLRPEEERAEVPGKLLVNADDPRVMEIWNLVFIQYNAMPDGSLQPLASKHVDTGMGFERVLAILQKNTSNYDTDLFLPILNRVAALSPLEDLTDYQNPGGGEEAEKRLIAMRVIADHVRAVAFAVADGVMPGNAGRGYVIRRILRRAVRYGYQTLGLKEPFLYRLIDTVREIMGETFPELDRSLEYIERVVRAEEESFLETLGTGLQYFSRLAPHIRQISDSDASDSAVRALHKDRSALDLLVKAYPFERDRDVVADLFAGVAGRGSIPGEIAFLLHDTYGFPVDLTQLMAREEGLSVDMERFSTLMDEQKTRARSAATFRIDQSSAAEWKVISDGEDSHFTGYESTADTGASIRSVRTVELDTKPPSYEVVLDRTPFYAESGGQLGDTGYLTVGDSRIEVLDTRKNGDQIVHFVDRLPDQLDSPVHAVVDVERRNRIVKHHSVTHLLHAALREVLGSHVAQKGSLVAPDHLRFDFSHFERVTSDVLKTIEDRVNGAIQRNIERQEERDVSIEEALSRGARALFGEKYGDTVRVITFDPEYSIELCGGIHVDATGEIGLFKFLSEGSVASGIRRVEAVAGADAIRYLHTELDELRRVRGLFKSLQRPTDEEVSDLLSANRRLEKELDQARMRRLEGALEGFVASAETVGGARLVTGEVAGVDMNELRALGEKLRDRLGDNAVGILGSADSETGKVYLVCTVSDDLLGRSELQAGKLVGILAEQLGGGGGGRATLATAGGRMPDKLAEVLSSSTKIIGEILS
ncbi:MAG: alanine--tRNA ligase, partial [Bacteroidetes bacterium]|nr:alanine--tRNA ligase [Bacteroidota bacterium]